VASISINFTLDIILSLQLPSNATIDVGFLGKAITALAITTPLPSYYHPSPIPLDINSATIIHSPPPPPTLKIAYTIHLDIFDTDPANYYNASLAEYEQILFNTTVTQVANVTYNNRLLDTLKFIYGATDTTLLQDATTDTSAFIFPTTFTVEDYSPPPALPIILPPGR